MTLEWVGVIPGKRESRRFVGHYTLTQNDFVNQTHFDDAVSFGGWAVDLHPADGVYSKLPSCSQYHSKGIYSIPYRCMISKDIDNLFIAGRSISATHVAFGTTRVMITAAHGGQAIGVAAALCEKYKCTPLNILESERIKELQNTLNLSGQSIPHIPIDLKSNLLADAQIESSSNNNFEGFSFDGGYRRLDFSIAQLLPLKKDTGYTFKFEVKAVKSTDLEIELMVSEKVYNYTPDRLIEKKVIILSQGEQMIELPFKYTLDHNQYAFIIIRRNDFTSIRMSNQIMTGLASFFNMYNKNANTLCLYIDSTGIGLYTIVFSIIWFVNYMMKSFQYISCNKGN